MTSRKDKIARILDDAKSRILAEVDDAAQESKATTKDLRGRKEKEAWAEVCSAFRDGISNYEETIDYLAAPSDDELVSAPPAGKRNTRRQHAKRFVDRFIARGLLKRDGARVLLADAA